jgi:hypothetical protein
MIQSTQRTAPTCAIAHQPTTHKQRTITNTVKTTRLYEETRVLMTHYNLSPVNKKVACIGCGRAWDMPMYRGATTVTAVDPCSALTPGVNNVDGVKFTFYPGRLESVVDELREEPFDLVTFFGAPPWIADQFKMNNLAFAIAFLSIIKPGGNAILTFWEDGTMDDFVSAFSRTEEANNFTLEEVYPSNQMLQFVRNYKTIAKQMLFSTPNTDLALQIRTNHLFRTSFPVPSIDRALMTRAYDLMTRATSICSALIITRQS